jgi:uncharacterized repeat protein (TIGR02543 family)
MRKKLIVLSLAVLMLALSVFSGCAKPFTVTFDGNGGEYVSGQQIQTVTKSSELVPPVYTRTGYTLVAWSEILSELKADATAKALWRANTYTLTYKQSDEYTLSATSKQVVYDQLVGALPEPVYVDGTHYFDCWRISAQGTSYDGLKVSASDTWQIDSDVTLVPTFTFSHYKITYKGMDGAKLDGENPNRYDETTGDITLINPTKDGYKFLGWSVGNQTELLDTVVIPAGSTGNKTFTANWEKYDYTVNFVVSDVVYGKKITMLYNGSAANFTRWIDDGESFGENMPTLTFKEGDELAYRFGGWYVKGINNVNLPFNGSTIFNADIMGVNDSITVYVDVAPLYTKPYA